MTAWLSEPDASRIANAFALEFFVRYVRVLSALVGADVEAAIIFLAILEANGRHIVRQPGFAADLADESVAPPGEAPRPISRQAVAESLGIPRETVRRRVSDLIERGFLVKTSGGVITTRAVVGGEQFVAARHLIAAHIRQLVLDLRQYAGMPIPGESSSQDDLNGWLVEPGELRIANALAIEFVLRYAREAAALFGNDYEGAVIFLTILEINGRQNIRQPWFVRDFADVRISLPAEMARAISRQGVAESLGSPRETVRRKIADLVQKGLLAEAPGGVITTRGVIGGEHFLTAQQHVVGYLRQFLIGLRQYTEMRPAGEPLDQS